MFNFWTRRARKSSTGQSQKSVNVLPLSQLDASAEAKASSSSPVNLAEDPSDQQKPEGSSHIESLSSSKEPRDEQASPQPALEPYVTVIPNPHDSTISEIKSGLRQIEVLTGGLRRSEQIQTGEHHPSSDHTLIESLFDPATGEQRGTFEGPHPTSPTESNPPFDHTASKAANDEVWSHLARIRELQSDIAKLHAHMEGIGDGRHVLDLDVDTDIDVDSVPTQEEEEAVKRETAFKKLPKRFNGRSQNIDSVMSKLDELSKAMTAFHALQPPSLNFQNNSASEETVDDKLQSPLSSRTSNPTNQRMSFPTSIHSAPGVGPRNTFSSGVGLVHESPVSMQASFNDPPIR